MGSDKGERPSLEVSFRRKRTAKVSPEEAIERFASRTAEAPVPAPPPAKHSAPVVQQQVDQKPARAPKAAKEPRAPKPPRTPRAPRAPRQPRAPRKALGITVASIVTGIVVGLVMVGAAAGSLKGCASLRGTSSCGGVGLPVLIVILAIGVILGSLMLRWLSRTPSSTSISFLAVAFVAVVSGLFLLGEIDSWPAVIIIPVLTVVGFWSSHWLTTHYIDPVSPPPVG